MPVSRRIPILTLALILGTPATGQTTIHVIDRPISLQAGARQSSSIERALADLASIRESGDRSPATILLHEKIWTVTQPLEIDAALAGEGLTIAAAAHASPTISGGRSLGPVRESGGVWRVALAPDQRFEELFVNGRPATRARHPNAGFARVVAAGADNRTSFTLDPAEIPPALLDSRSEVVLLHDWSTSRVRIDSVEGNTVALASPIGCKAPHYAITNFEPHPRFFVEGSPTLLDAPGEWAIDGDELVYVPLPDELAEESSLIVPVAPALLRVLGTRDDPVTNVTIRGVRFAHASWPIPEYGYAEGQASFYEQRDNPASDGTRDSVPPAVEFVWATGCAVERCTIESVGGGGIWIGEGCAGCVVSDTIVRDTGANGIMIGEASGRTVAGQVWWQAAPEQAARGNRVEHCLIERCGRRFFGAVGVWIGLATETTVAGCEIRDLPYTGVSVGWRWDETPTPCRGNVIEGNHIHGVMRALSDGGGIYTLGLQPGTVLQGNAIHDIRRNAGRAPSNGMFLDQGTTDIVIEGNTFWAIDTTPIRWHWSYANTVRGNVFVLDAGQRIAHYNRAEASDIVYTDNRTIDPDAWDGGEVESVIRAAGPR